MKYKTIDLCAGIGGIRRGFELTNRFQNIASAEIDELASRTYEHLFGDNPRNDVTSDQFKNSLKSLHYDVLLAGFPCQAFSSVGLKKGFEDTTKGTIFFDIAKIIKGTLPKAVFLENVENLTVHDKGNTFRTIIEILETELNYKVIGVTKDLVGNLTYDPHSFIRNSKNFGVPQNRPRVYIVAFSRDYFGSRADELLDELPHGSNRIIYNSLTDVLEQDIPPRFFLSSGYLETLEKHKARQKEHGNGFGYRIVNAPEIEHPIANTLLATGGSGKERNLIYDERNGRKYSNTEVKGKKSPINTKNIRMMTPTEWGKLQGFINYAFVDEKGIDHFSFPDSVPNAQQYKQFGNSVTIPVIREMAQYIVDCLDYLTSAYNTSEKRLYSMYGDEYLVCSAIYRRLGSNLREKTLNEYFDLVFHFKCHCEFRNLDVAKYLGYSTARSSQILGQIMGCQCLSKDDNKLYSFHPPQDYCSLSKGGSHG